MEIIASTKTGALVSATNEEINEILNAVNGVKPDAIKIGMKIPAIDYASTIRKIKTLPENREVVNLFDYAERFIKVLDALKQSITSASSINN